MKNEKFNIVCSGGGTGLSGELSGLKHNPRLDISAIVAMTDRGGSSGELRDQFGGLPPGDIFRCILALAPDEDQPTIRRIFNRRLAQNHSPGNLFMFGAEQAYKSYQQAVDELCKTFSAAGRVYPVATRPSNLCANFTDGRTAKTEPEVDRIMSEGGLVNKLYLRPAVSANEAALEAIRNADIFCIGPGSFYTSVLPIFLHGGVSKSMQASKAPIIFVLNLMTEGRGMKDLIAPVIVQTLEKYLGCKVDRIIMNNYIPPNLPKKYARKERKYPVSEAGTMDDPRYVKVPLWTDGSLARHDPAILSSVIWQVADQLLRL